MENVHFDNRNQPGRGSAFPWVINPDKFNQNSAFWVGWKRLKKSEDSERKRKKEGERKIPSVVSFQFFYQFYPSKFMINSCNGFHRLQERTNGWQLNLLVKHNFKTEDPPAFQSPAIKRHLAWPNREVIKTIVHRQPQSLSQSPIESSYVTKKGRYSFQKSCYFSNYDFCSLEKGIFVCSKSYSEYSETHILHNNRACDVLCVIFTGWNWNGS